MMVNGGKLSDPRKRPLPVPRPGAVADGLRNIIPTSYFRLVPHQEAPTNICWGDRNRSVLVRVPLGWNAGYKMFTDANPLEKEPDKDFSSRQTVEFRCPDGSADMYLLLAGLTVAARHGIEMKTALTLAQQTYVDVNIFEEKHKHKLKDLHQLPYCCWQSAEYLEKQRGIYEAGDVFPPIIIDGLIRKLRSYNDLHLRENIKDNDKEIMKMVNTYLHCG